MVVRNEPHHGSIMTVVDGSVGIDAVHKFTASY